MFYTYVESDFESYSKQNPNPGRYYIAGQDKHFLILPDFQGGFFYKKEDVLYLNVVYLRLKNKETLLINLI